MFKRLKNLIKGFFGVFISDLEKSNPRVMIENERENLRKKIIEFNENLANQAAFAERLTRQMKQVEHKEKELVLRIKSNIKMGKREIAGQLAIELNGVKDQIEDIHRQFEDAENTYKKLIESRDVSIQEAKLRIEKLKRTISETEMLEAQADLQEMAAGLLTGSKGSSESLNRLEEQLEERRSKAVGRTRVASSSINDTDLEDREEQQVATAEQALAEFETAYGIETGPGSALGNGDTDTIELPPRKEMGPQEDA